MILSILRRNEHGVIGFRCSLVLILTEFIFERALTDVNGDNKIGLAEVIYILQDIAGLR